MEEESVFTPLTHSTYIKQILPWLRHYIIHSAREGTLASALKVFSCICEEKELKCSKTLPKME